MSNDDKSINPTIIKLFLWSGVVVIAGLIVAQGLIMGFVPAPPPSLPAEELAQIFIDKQGSIAAGSLIQIIVWSFYSTWAIAIVAYMRKMEKGIPILSYAAIANIGGGYVFFLMIPATWATIAIRADTLSPEIKQIMTDWVWFQWLFTWPPFSIFMFLIAGAILLDHNIPKLYPRWVAWFNIWAGVLIFPAGLIVFFKDGPFAYDGLISFWFAVVVFFGWITIMTIETYKLANKDSANMSQ
jgi:hypothetical protein